MKPFPPGSQFHQWTVQEVLGWGHRGGLYRVGVADQRRILKQILFPPLPASESTQRRRETEEAIIGWNRLALPQAIWLEEVLWHEDSLCLVMAELQGQPLAVQPVLVPPASTQLVYWCEQILSLVLVLQRHENPLKYSLLDPDHVILDPLYNHPICFNPGWSTLAWTGAQGMQQMGLQKALKSYGKLIQLLGGAEANLSPALLWMVGRCLSENPTQNYASFEEVRLSLQRLPIKQGQRSFASRQSLDEFPAVDSWHLPDQDLPPLPPGVRWLGVLVALFSVLFLMAVWLQPPPQPLPALAVVSRGKVHFLTERGESLGEIDLKAPVQDGVASPSGDVLYLALKGSPQVAVVGVASRRVRYLGLNSEARSLDFGQSKLFCLEESGQVALFERLGPREKPLPSQHVEGLLAPLKIRLRDEGKEFLVLESNRLHLVGEGQGEVWESWSEPLLVSALALESSILASLRDGSLQILSSALAPLSRLELPGGGGRTELYRNRYRRQFWTLHSEGTLGLWNHPEVNLAGKLNLDLHPAAVADDPLGRLWVLSDQGDLLRIDSQESLQFEKVGRLKLRDIDALLYLHHPQGSATSR